MSDGFAGGCLCGTVRHRAVGALDEVAARRCTRCRRHQGPTGRRAEVR
jgi:hypothetical protein